MVGLVGSGKRRTWSPLARTYSVIPSTEVTLAGAAAGAGFAFGAGAVAAAWAWRPAANARPASRERSRLCGRFIGPSEHRAIGREFLRSPDDPIIRRSDLPVSLPRVGDPVDRPRLVVGDEERPFGRHEDVHGPPPDLSPLEPPFGEGLVGRGLPLRLPDEHDAVPDLVRSIPGSVLG